MVELTPFAALDLVNQVIKRLVGEKLFLFFGIVPISSRELDMEPHCIDYPISLTHLLFIGKASFATGSLCDL